MVSIPQKKPGQRSGNSEIVLMDLSSRSIEVIVDGNSDIYDRVIEEMNRGYPVINSSYIAWYDGWIAHTYLYDYHKKEMIEVIIELDYGSGLRAANEKMLDNGVIVVIYDGSAVRISKLSTLSSCHKSNKGR